MNVIDYSTTPKAKQSRSRRPWMPDAFHLEIFERVRMLGEKQQAIALSLGINQSTVSRIVARVERWQSRATPQQAGRLTHGERLRAQTLLTFERNELLIASCLRMAARMESTGNYVHTTTRHQNPAEREKITLRDEQLDSGGVAARFLRLAFRINMEQLKLARADELPPLEPLSAEELAEEEQGAQAAAAELHAALAQFRETFDENHRRAMEEESGVGGQESGDRGQDTGDRGQETEEPVARDQEPVAKDQGPVARDQEPVDQEEPAAVHSLHNLHNENGHALAASPNGDSTYAENGRAEKSAGHACIARRKAKAK